MPITLSLINITSEETHTYNAKLVCEIIGCHITGKISCNKCKFLGWKKCLGLLPFPMLCIPMVVSQVSGQVVSDAK